MKKANPRIIEKPKPLDPALEAFILAAPTYNPKRSARKITLTFPEEQVPRLQAHANMTGETKAGLARRVVMEWMTRVEDGGA